MNVSDREYIELWIQMQRERKSQAECARKCGITPNTFIRKMFGRNAWTNDEMYILCDFLNIPESKLSFYFPRRKALKGANE